MLKALAGGGGGGGGAEGGATGDDLEGLIGGAGGGAGGPASATDILQRLQTGLRPIEQYAVGENGVIGVRVQPGLQVIPETIRSYQPGHT